MADANASIRGVSLILIVLATALGAILSIIFSRSIAKRLCELTAVMGKISEGDIKNMGDTSTLADPSVVDALVKGRL